MQASQNTSVFFKTQNKFDISLTSNWSKDLAFAFNKINELVPSKKQNDSNFVHTKCGNFRVYSGTVSFPTVDSIMRVFPNLFDTLCFIQSPVNNSYFKFYLKTNEKYSKHKLTEATKHLIESLTDSRFGIQDIKFEQSHQFTEGAKISIRDYIRQYTNNNVSYQHLVLINDGQQNQNQVDLTLSKLKTKIDQQAVQLFATACKTASHQFVSQMQQLPAQERYQQLRFTDTSQIKSEMLKTSYLTSLDETIRTFFKEDVPQDQVDKYYNMLSTQACIGQFIQQNQETEAESFMTMLSCSYLSDIGKEKSEVVHTSPLIFIKKHYQDLIKEQVLELSPYKFEFWINILIIAKWFAQYILSNEDESDAAALCLYGAAGAGKSEILNSISQYCANYKWLWGSQYQSPELSNASIAIVNEFDLDSCIDKDVKTLLDFKDSCKINFKNIAPFNCTRYLPFLMTTNSDPVETFKTLQQKKKVTIDSIIGGMRRYLFVPFVQTMSKVYPAPQATDNISMEIHKQFVNATKIKPQLFNLIFILACLQDKGNINVDHVSMFYVQELFKKLQQTVWGSFYLNNKEYFDNKINEIYQGLNKVDRLEAIKEQIQQMKEQKFFDFNLYVAGLSEKYDITGNLTKLQQQNELPNHVKMLIISKDVRVRDSLDTTRNLIALCNKQIADRISQDIRNIIFDDELALMSFSSVAHSDDIEHIADEDLQEMFEVTNYIRNPFEVNEEEPRSFDPYIKELRLNRSDTKAINEFRATRQRWQPADKLPQKRLFQQVEEEKSEDELDLGAESIRGDGLDMTLDNAIAKAADVIIRGELPEKRQKKDE